MGEFEEARSTFDQALDLYRTWLPQATAPEAEHYKDYGIGLQRRGRDAEAVGALRRAIEAGAADGETLRYLALCLLNLHQVAEAEDYARQALEATPSNPDAFKILGDSLAAQGRKDEAVEAYVSAARGERARPDEALKLLEKALRLAPDSYEALVTKARTLYSVGRNDEALDVAERARQLDHPDTVPSLVTLAKILAAMARYDEALERIESALQIDPTDATALATKADILRQKKDLDQAADLVDAVLEADPSNLTALNVKAEILMARRQPVEAVEVTKRVLGSRPDSVRAIATQAAALYDLQRYDEALEACERALALRPDHAAVLAIKAQVLRQEDRLKEALESAERALALDPGSEVAFGVKADVLRAQGKLDDALATLDRAIEANSGYGFAHELKGRILEQQGRLPEALEAIGRALEIDPENPSALAAKADVLRQQGEYPEALDLLNRSIDLRPNASGTWESRGAVLFELDDYQGAAASFERAIELGGGSAETFAQLGEAKRFRGEFDGAVAAYDRALALGDTSLEVVRGKAFSLMDAHRYGEAIETLDRPDLDSTSAALLAADRAIAFLLDDKFESSWDAVHEALRLDPGSVWALTVKAAWLLSAAEFDRSRELLEGALAADDRNAWRWSLEGFACLNLALGREIGERTELAQQGRTAFERALELNGSVVGWYGARAESFALTDRTEEARAAYEDALKRVEGEAGPLTADLLNSRGWSLFRLRRFREAVKSFIDAVSGDSTYLTPQFNLALALMANGQTELALGEYQRGLERAKQHDPLGVRGTLRMALNDLNEAVRTGLVVDDEQPSPQQDEPAGIRKLFRRGTKEMQPAPPQEPSPSQEAARRLQEALEAARAAKDLPGEPGDGVPTEKGPPPRVVTEAP